ncbi:hypothetical protein GCM10023107_01170 [Actinoplanes octamycinicus]
MSYPLRDGGLDGAEAARRAIDVIEKQVGAGNVAAVLIEPIQGEGGFVVPAPGFLPALAAWAAEAGAVFIADEIQTGFCRTGQWFASEHEGLEPDLITTAKGMAAGCRSPGWSGGLLSWTPCMPVASAGPTAGTRSRVPPRSPPSRPCASWIWPARRDASRTY